MARIFNLETDSKAVTTALARSLQSGHANFLLGSGASLPGVSLAGAIEQEIAALVAIGDEDEARLRLYAFLNGIQEPTNRLIDDAAGPAEMRSLEQYAAFLQVIEVILSERRTSLLPKQATLFTTNYDLFVEKASINSPGLKLNDGFSRVPSLDNRMEYSSRNFFNVTYSTGNLYDYKVELPSINLVKLHGSLSWAKDGDAIIFHVVKRDALAAGAEPAQVAAFIDKYSVVLPQAAKFRTTLMDRTYYELLRIYANELDRPNTLLVSFGFSFNDEHILDITKRALRNPTLRLVIFAFDTGAQESFREKLDDYSNVEIIAPPVGKQLEFKHFIEVLRSCYSGV